MPPFRPILVLRSLLFILLFYANLLLQLVVFAPVLLVAREGPVWRIIGNWARSSLWLLRVVAGTRSRIGGRDNIPPGPAIIAPKHQSFWDVVALLSELDRPTFILKTELMAIPLFGWWARRLRMIPVDRAKRGATLSQILKGAQDAVADGRPLVIFPEGTRTEPGADEDYRPGVFHLYAGLGLPIVPVALNSGLFWPRKAVSRHPGTIRAEFLPPIPPGLGRTELLARLKGDIETACVALLQDAFAERPDLPMSRRVAARLGREAADPPA